MADFEDIRATPGQSKSSILFTIGAKTQVNVSAKHVFDTIINFSEYEKWNQDTPQMTLPESEVLKVGSKLDMKVIMVDQKKEYNVPIEILRFENPGEDGTYVLSWRGQMLPSWFALSERVQEVRPIEGQDGVCEVVNYESMSGWGAYVFKYVMGIPVQMKKFNLKYLDDLKKRAEQTVWSEFK